MDLKKRIVLIIGASRPEKTWPFNLWTALSKKLLSDSVFKEFQVIVIWGTQQERERAVALAEHHSRIRPLDILMSPPNLASFLSESSLVIGTDSGPTHLAATVGAQTLMLFGVTAPEQNSSSEVQNLITLGSVNAWPTVTEVFDKARLQCTSKADFSVSNCRLTTRNETE
jgi:ADP-heptose:LPS heptosyltransferase